MEQMNKMIAKIEEMETVLEGSAGQKIELTIDAAEQKIIRDALETYKGVLRLKEQIRPTIDLDELREATKGITV